MWKRLQKIKTNYLKKIILKKHCVMLKILEILIALLVSQIQEQYFGKKNPSTFKYIMWQMIFF